VSRVLLKIISEVSRVMITVIYLTRAAAAVTAGGVDKWIRLRDNIHLVGERRI